MPLSEAAVQSLIRVRAAELGVTLWRNNVGACEDKTGRIIRYGLANDTPQLQKRFKSADLIGFIPVKTPLGNFAQMLAVECKRSDWHANPGRYDERELAQFEFLKYIAERGGIAGFVRSVAEFERLIGAI